MSSDRLVFALSSVVLSFIFMVAVFLLKPVESVAGKAIDATGWFLVAVATGYLTTKAIEHFTRGKPNG